MKDFEKNLKRLDEIVDEIEKNETLSGALSLYKEGIGLLAEASVSLQQFDEEIEILEKGE
ncbi:MAG: exodeoxyribonuclease VII small subunit [Defluviitaleaceae bacterium]|nr:exodeoxyribonuclease VII small subunit [Defluviitaleaceae bacterium]